MFVIFDCKMALRSFTLNIGAILQRANYRAEINLEIAALVGYLNKIDTEIYYNAKLLF